MPDVIKIDVEGAEAHVLAGGPAVLRAHPRIICEVAKENAAAVSDLLARSGYTLYDGEQPASQRLPASEAPPNTLAIRGPWPARLRDTARYGAYFRGPQLSTI